MRIPSAASLVRPVVHQLFATSKMLEALARHYPTHARTYERYSRALYEAARALQQATGITL